MLVQSVTPPPVRKISDCSFFVNSLPSLPFFRSGKNLSPSFLRRMPKEKVERDLHQYLKVLEEEYYSLMSSYKGKTNRMGEVCENIKIILQCYPVLINSSVNKKNLTPLQAIFILMGYTGDDHPYQPVLHGLALKLLEEHWQDIDLLEANKNGSTLLHLAFRYGFAREAKKIIAIADEQGKLEEILERKNVFKKTPAHTLEESWRMKDENKEYLRNDMFNCLKKFKSRVTYYSAGQPLSASFPTLPVSARPK